MEKESFFVHVKEMIEEYVDDRLLLLKMQATEKAAKSASVAFITVIVLFLSLLLFMIISFIAGYYLSVWVGNYPAGFGILGGIYVLLIFVMLIVHRKYTAKMVADKVVKFSFESKEAFEHEV